MASLERIKGSNGSGEAVRAVVQSLRTSGSSTLDVDSVTNWSGDFIGTYGTPDGNGSITPSSVRVFYGTISGTDIDITGFAPGYTDDGNAVGDIVVLKPTTAWADNVAELLAVIHNDDGTLKADTVDTQAIEAEAVDNSKLKTGAGEPGGVWNSWTPTFTNLSGGTLNYAKYKRVGKTIHFRLKYTLSGAGVGGAVLFTLPESANADYNNNAASPYGNATFIDDGVGSFFGTVNYGDSTANAAIRCQRVSGSNISNSALSSTVPYTWASNDVILVQGAYEAA